jgi:tRNA dimethylallyltransferase
VVNTDAFQVYRGMDIGTAKVPPAQRRGIPHHLLDLLTVREPLTVAHFQDQARETAARLRDAGTTPVLVGGSALYTRAVLDRFDFPATDEAVRARWEAELERVGPRALHARLAEIDPEAAAKMVPDNGRRVVRALEVIEITGEPWSAALPELTYADPATVQVGLTIDRPTLDRRIEQRVAEMFEAGLVAEVERLLDEGLAEGRTASRAIGYREVAAYLAGETSLDAARERTVIGTRQFSRRQDAWFKKDPRIVWVPFDAPDRIEQALAAVQRT